MASTLPPVKNAAFSFDIALVDQGDTDVFQTSVTLAAGDVLVSKDNGAFANITSLPVEIGTSGVLAVGLTATEMNADRVTVLFHDAAGAEWQDALVTIYTATQTLDTTDGVADGIKTKTDYLPSVAAGASGGLAIVGSAMTLADDAITAAKIAADAIGSSELAATAATEIAEAVAAIVANDQTWGWVMQSLDKMIESGFGGTRYLTATALTLAASATELAKVPKSDGTVTWNATALASINAEVDAALNTAIPGSPTADSINERIKAIDDLTQASGAGDLAAILDDTGTSGVKLAADALGSSQLAASAAAEIAAAVLAGGAGTYSYSNTVDDGSGNLLDGVFVQCATDAAFTNIVHATHTNSVGAFTVYSDISGTHYLRLQLAGYTFANQTVTLA